MTAPMVLQPDIDRDIETPSREHNGGSKNYAAASGVLEVLPGSIWMRIGST